MELTKELREEYVQLYNSMKVDSAGARYIAKRIFTNKGRYTDVAGHTKVPWYVIGAIHAMEAGLHFTRSLHNGQRWDKETTIVSIPEDTSIPMFKKSEVLFASEYLDEYIDLSIIDNFKSILKRNVGYSDHSIGIDKCVEAHEKYGCNFIEKHFTLEKDVVISGKVFRDTIHGLTPKEFEKLAIKIE